VRFVTIRWLYAFNLARLRSGEAVCFTFLIWFFSCRVY